MNFSVDRSMEVLEKTPASRPRQNRYLSGLWRGNTGPIAGNLGGSRVMAVQYKTAVGPWVEYLGILRQH